MGMATILFNGAEPFKQIVNILSKEGPMWNMEKIAQAVSEKKIFKDNSFLQVYSPRARVDKTPGEKILTN